MAPSLPPAPPPPPSPPPALTDDLLQEIFLRVASPADLARASTACPSFRRLIADDPAFLRRYRSLHAPLFLGFLKSMPDFGFQPAEAPHPNAPAARALARAADFSVDHLPPPRWQSWYVCDVLDGLVLYGCEGPLEHDVSPDIAVSDPLSRRYLLLPPVPGDQFEGSDMLYSEVFFAHPADEAAFRVIAVMHCQTKSVVFIFDSGSGGWSVGASISWEALDVGASTMLCCRCYVYGCFYWKFFSTKKLLKLDMNMEFSIVDLPPDLDGDCIAVVEAGDGRLGLFSHISDDTFLNYYTSVQSEGHKAGEWQMKNTIPLPVHDDLIILCAPQGYIFLLCKVQDMTETICFSLEIETLKIEKVCQMRFSGFYSNPYFGFPPSMSPRRL
ncbi:hypothetical protein ACP4OV_007279 [Aristida adscensionis]